MRWHKVSKHYKEAWDSSDSKQESYPEIEEYIGKLQEQIRNSKARAMVAEEIRSHIQDQAEEYESQGMEKEKAVLEAVRQMGDPVGTGVDMDRIHRPRMSWLLLGLIVGFSILGLALQYVCFYGMEEVSAAYQGMAGTLEENFYRQCIYTILGLMVMVGVCFLDYSRIGKYSQICGFCFLAGLLMICETGNLFRVNARPVWFLFPMINGGYPYLKCLLYLFVPLFGGILYANRQKGYWALAAGLLWILFLFLTGMAVGGGLGGVIDVTLTCFVMLFLAIGKGWFGKTKRIGLAAAGVFTLALGLGIGFRAMTAYQIDRLRGLFMAGGEDSYNYVNVRVREIVANLSLNGSSMAVLKEKGLLPWENVGGIQHDFIFLQIISQLGMIKTLMLCVCLAGILIAMLYAVMKQKNQMGQMMGLGCVMLLALETARTVLNNMGLFVASTNGLMFFSYGKGHTMIVYVLLGVVLSIYRHKDLVWERPKRQETGAFSPYPYLDN